MELHIVIAGVLFLFLAISFHFIGKRMKIDIQTQSIVVPTSIARSLPLPEREVLIREALPTLLGPLKSGPWCIDAVRHRGDVSWIEIENREGKSLSLPIAIDEKRAPYVVSGDRGWSAR